MFLTWDYRRNLQTHRTQGVQTSFVETMVKSLLGANNENNHHFFCFSISSQRARGTAMLIKIANCKIKPIRHFFSQFWSEANLFCPKSIMRYFLQCSSWIFVYLRILNETRLDVDRDKPWNSEQVSCPTMSRSLLFQTGAAAAALLRNKEHK